MRQLLALEFCTDPCLARGSGSSHLAQIIFGCSSAW